MWVILNNKEKFKLEQLKENNFWRIETWNYSNNYKKYFDEDKIVMGLGDDLDLKECILDLDKEIIHKYKSSLQEFLEIKKGDYVEWILYDRVNEGEESYLQVNKVLGKVMQYLSECYEFIKNIGHMLPIQVIEKSTIRKYNSDCIEMYEISDWDSEWVEEFESLPRFKIVKRNKLTKWYLNFVYFGLENIEYDENKNEITFKDFSDNWDNESVLDKLKLLKKGNYVFGDFISKNNDGIDQIIIIGRVIQEWNLEKNTEVVLEVKCKSKNKNNNSAIINIYSEEDEESINFINNKLRKNKNIILYGPPGTGKTYGISNEILKIINPYMIIDEDTEKEDINIEIKELQEDNRIKYCTFHQSYGYEEFIEGLRSDGEGNFVLEDGILKEIAIEALLDGLVYGCKAELLNEIEDINSKEEKSEREIKAKKKELVLKYINQSHKFDFYDCNQYVIVIDEINRGNISKIFGELITLLEEDKRLTKENEMLIKLPYSKEDFILPPNLHLIGTMNTSDKSIAPIDIALRRRFKFIERMPEEELLSTIDGIDLSKMLKRINDRIEYLYDRDHVIGHAYFINLHSLKEIIDTIDNKIIPLLQEYFYEDWQKIGMVLGGIGRAESDSYIIYKKDIKPQNLFKNSSEEDLPIISKYYIKSEIGEQEIKSIYE